MSKHALAGRGGMPLPVLKPLSPGPTRPIRIARQVCIVGSHSRVHLPLHSAMVSRAHALIVVDGNETFVRDLASRNGIYVNGALVREGKLRHGDLLCVGPFAFWWRIGLLPGPRPRHLGRHFDAAAQLFVEGEPDPHRMEGQSFVIGGRAECDIVLNEPTVDACHAVIYRRGGEFHVRDLNSTAGTFVNGQLIRDAALCQSDELRIGTTRIEFQLPIQPPSLEERVAPDLEYVTGLAGASHADQKIGRIDLATMCPTIEQLLGVAPTASTRWGWGRF